MASGDVVYCRICLRTNLNVKYFLDNVAMNFIERIFKENGFFKDLNSSDCTCFECYFILNKSCEFVQKALKAQKLLYQYLLLNEPITTYSLSCIDRKKCGISSNLVRSEIEIYSSQTNIKNPEHDTYKTSVTKESENDNIAHINPGHDEGKTCEIEVDTVTEIKEETVESNDPDVEPPTVRNDAENTLKLNKSELSKNDDANYKTDKNYNNNVSTFDVQIAPMTECPKSFPVKFETERNTSPDKGDFYIDPCTGEMDRIDPSLIDNSYITELETNNSKTRLNFIKDYYCNNDEDNDKINDDTLTNDPLSFDSNLIKSEHDVKEEIVKEHETIVVEISQIGSEQGESNNSSNEDDLLVEMSSVRRKNERKIKRKPRNVNNKKKKRIKDKQNKDDDEKLHVNKVGSNPDVANIIEGRFRARKNISYSGLDSGTVEKNLDDEFVPASDLSDDDKEEFRVYPMECEECDSIIGSKTEHYHHYLLQHKDKEYPYKKYFKSVLCPDCGEYITERQLKVHKDKHSGIKHKCDICNKYYSSHPIMLAHKMYVHNKKNKNNCPTCDYCDKSFGSKGDLKIHIRIHTGERPYKCHLCEYRCAHKGNIHSHIRQYHQHLRPEPKRVVTKKKGKKRRRRKTSDSDTD